ncbi:MAG: DUF4250 domain-containing protein [Huintestinicola sp.]
MDSLPKDPIMLMSVVNTKLRDHYPSLDVLCEDMDINKDILTEKLAAAGFSYNSELNRFV